MGKPMLASTLAHASSTQLCPLGRFSSMPRAPSFHSFFHCRPIHSVRTLRRDCTRHASAATMMVRLQLCSYPDARRKFVHESCSKTGRRGPSYSSIVRGSREKTQAEAVRACTLSARSQKLHETEALEYSGFPGVFRSLLSDRLTSRAKGCRIRKPYSALSLTRSRTAECRQVHASSHVANPNRKSFSP